MKTHRKRKVIILVAAAVILTAVIVLLFWRPAGTSSGRSESSYTGDIAVYVSQTDKDDDGIDDQTEILQSAVNYTKTKPKYKSKYYEGGYPDDGYGVCTDLVAAALKGAGYDLRKLVDQDIHQHLEDYNIDKPDANIDYRRVQNLRVWFKNNAISCTLNIKKVDQWQGGDIVIFKNHIGIVSDRRNDRGVPYVLHHYSPRQRHYEEDILEKRNDIVGHYRMS